MKTNKKVLVSTIFLVCLSLCTSWGLFKHYKSQPSYIVNAYMKAINNRDYAAATSLFYEDERLHTFNDTELVQFLSEYFEEKGFVRMEEGRGQVGELEEEATKAFYEVRYSFEAQNVTSTLSVVKAEGKWQVVFPFKIEDVNIYTPLGSSVWFNEEPITNKEDNKYIVKNVLPGNYIVRIAFPNEICSDYITNVDVPAETEVIIPYQTVAVNIEALPGTIVELGGEKKANYEGSVDFENVLEGTYALKIYDTYGNIETYEEKITVSNTQNQFDIEGFKLSQIGSKRFTKSINAFYDAYIQAIKKHDSEILTRHILETNREEVVEEFKDWFITHKDVQNAQIKIELEEVRVTKEGDLAVQALEMIDLINQENKENVNYKIALTWHMIFTPDGEVYKLQDRKLEESLVSYQDKDGKWLAY